MKQYRKKFKHAIWARPWVYLPFFRLHARIERLGVNLKPLTGMAIAEPSWVAGPATQLVLEGFDRSANTFALFAFLRTPGNGSIKVAHHLHNPAQLVFAVRRNVPAILLIRRPLDAVISNVQRGQGEMTVPAVLRRLSDWTSFYKSLLPVRAQLVVASFDEVTADFGRIVRRLNSRFGTDFAEFNHTDENVRAIFSEIERRNAEIYNNGKEAVEHMVARPSVERAERKAEFEAILRSDAHAMSLFGKADRLYDAFVAGVAAPTTKQNVLSEVGRSK